MRASGWLYDGESARRWPVEVEPDPGRPDAVLVHAEGRESESVTAAEFVRTDDRGDAVVFTRPDADGWQLSLLEPIPADVDERLPRTSRYGAWIDRIGLGRFAVAAAAVSAAIIALMWVAPAWLAPAVPESWERDFGRAWLGDIEEEAGCRAEAGRAALARLERRLSPGRDFRVTVVDFGMENAAALPGGDIVLFRPVIENAGSPEEVAGILAHELAHVENRHVTEALIREFGFGLVLTSVGGNAGGTMNQLTGLSHSRSAEREADEDAIDALIAADISPRGAADFFRRVIGQPRPDGKEADGSEEVETETETNTIFDSEWAEFLGTHPAPSGRIERFEAAAEGRAFGEAMPAEDWKALQAICQDSARDDAAS